MCSSLYTSPCHVSKTVTNFYDFFKGTPLDKIPQTTNGIAPRTCNSRTDAWSYKSDEIDPSVLNELPLEIQAEVRAWMQPQKRANVVKKGSSIAHYFSPTPNS